MSSNARISKALSSGNSSLPLPDGKIIAKYIWIDGTGKDIRCKDRTMDFIPTSREDLPIWNYDGSSTFQAEGSNSDVHLYPVAIYKDPFRFGENILVLCETYRFNMKPTDSNKRKHCLETVNKCKDEVPSFSIEQEFTFLAIDLHPLNGFPGADKVYAREIVDAFRSACLNAGVKISEPKPGLLTAHWTYQVGPGRGISSADDLWMSRFLLHRIAEEFGVVAKFYPIPNPIVSEWNAHTNTNVSFMNTSADNQTYDPRGEIESSFEMCTANQVACNVIKRSAPIRISRGCAQRDNEYFADRRPEVNYDPYSAIDAAIHSVFLP